MLNDTITAIATSLSPSGIGIIRISGDDALNIIKEIFRPINNDKDINEVKSHTIHYGHIVEDNNVIDEVLVSIMKGPNTFTRENVVEINCHGGIIVMQKILKLTLKQGARIAEPGEFTKRAFLNGRIDLSQAEAVIDIINSKTDLALRSSVSQLEGSIREKIIPIRTELLEIIAHIEASIDYPEYDIDELSFNHLKQNMEQIIKRIRALLDTADYGKILRDGVKTVIVGKPNVGKSSLMNTLLKEERAIVTDIPGTTRDTLEELVNINGIPLKIIDTAGIRDTEDIVEKIGVEKSKKYIDQSDLIIFVIDISRELDEEDYKIIELIKDRKTVVLLNKSDLSTKIDVNELKEKIKKPLISISIKTKEGIVEFEEILKNMFFNGDIDFSNDTYITNVRHKDALEKSIKSLNNVIETINLGLPEDCISIDLQNGYESLGLIIGESMDESIIDQIFSQFCLGK
ncbi:tRNA modification GTPase [Natranaerovirga pectinivora]|uniref:tRNA modification GTPase MnmE n=1 Tax=Natranaerovirga pectinivora TaxID=682400 RepID=A0A4R3MIM4_9FIRM|nr:tRNA uridine-5-carboxymethylaminomethyl(34) synthesis GTPase MnmE [Natranaerovirga pectinivora]TCT12246.1 tRNA modification GTPase [Natranaerovirga pectinivora]